MIAKKALGVTVALLIITLPGDISFADPHPHEILNIADKARGNVDGLQWTVHIVSTEKERQQERELFVQSKEFDFLATFTAPSRIKRQKLLMVKQNMWFMKPGLRKPVPISPRQRLIGGASYGDIAATNYSGDYKPELLDDEMVNNELCYVFDLKSINKKATYDRIVYWISKERLVGLKADFYTVSGKKFKSAMFEYSNRIKNGEEDQPLISKMTITDTFLKNNTTIMDYKNYSIVDIPPATFSTNFLMTR